MKTTDNRPTLVTGAAGQLGAVGRTVTCLLLDLGLPVRAMVRREDDRAAALRAAGADVVVGDLLEPDEVYRIVQGCGRVYFGMSVSAGYLEASVTMAAVALEVGKSQRLLVDDAQEAWRAAAMLDVGLAFRVRRRQIEGARLGQKAGQIGRYGGAPAAAVLGLGIVLARAAPGLDGLDGGREGNVAGRTGHGGFHAAGASDNVGTVRQFIALHFLFG